MIITSPDFEEGRKIPKIFTCEGSDTAPDLIFSDPPKEAQSLALIMDDPDAPMHTWTHWLIWNLPAKTKKIEGGIVPDESIEGLTSSGNAGYHGPCPSEGEHRYFFRLYALDSKIILTDAADRHQLEQAMADHIIETSDLMGIYGKEE